MRRVKLKKIVKKAMLAAAESGMRVFEEDMTERYAPINRYAYIKADKNYEKGDWVYRGRKSIKNFIGIAVCSAKRGAGLKVCTYGRCLAKDLNNVWRLPCILTNWPLTDMKSGASKLKRGKYHE